jgi:hypothetical protein
VISHSDFLMKFTSDLKTRGALPKNIELSRIGHVFLASVFNELKSEIITESIFSGMDTNPDIAVLKGLVEMTERLAFFEGSRKGLSSCSTERSDGFAAFPYGLVANTQEVARENARNEAIERFVWASWWDNVDFSHECRRVASANCATASEALLGELGKVLSIDSIFRISPTIARGEDSVLAIYFAFLEPFGVISGGACGSSGDIEITNFRAVCELFRHALAIRKMKQQKIEPITFYERRLAHFGLTKEGAQSVKDRISARGKNPVVLPALEIDEAVPHSLDKMVFVYRCYFEGQPPFVGGKLERLCL